MSLLRPSAALPRPPPPPTRLALRSYPPAPPPLFPPNLRHRCFTTNKRSKGSRAAYRLFEMATKSMAGRLAGAQPLHVTDVEFAVRKLHDSFIAAQVTRIHSSQSPQPIAYARPPSRDMCLASSGATADADTQHSRTCSCRCPIAWLPCLKRRMDLLPLCLALQASQHGLWSSRSTSGRR